MGFKLLGARFWYSLRILGAEWGSVRRMNYVAEWDAQRIYIKITAWLL